MRITPLEAKDSGTDLPALLLVHGLMSSHNHWLANWERLSRRYRLIAVDLPGHGVTPPASAPEALAPLALVDSLEALRVRLGIETWAICGQSLGAGITLRYAVTYPDVVAAQIFTNANAALKVPLGPEDRAFLAERAARLRREGVPAMRAERFHPMHAKRFSPTIRDILARDADGIDPVALGDLLDHTLPHLGLARELARTSVPTLLVNGRWESRFQPLRDWAAKTMPDLTIVDLEGGHSINIEQAKGFDQAVLAFLEHAWPIPPCLLRGETPIHR